MNNEEKKAIIDRECDDFASEMMPFGWIDVRCALEILEEVKSGYYKYSTAKILYNIIEEFKDSTGIDKNEDLDVCYLVLEDILQKARNKIIELTGYDFQNDYHGIESEICVYGNYCASSFDYSEEAEEELIKKIKKHREELEEDVFVRYLLEDLNI